MNQPVMYVAQLKYGCKIEKRFDDIAQAVEYSQKIREQGMSIEFDHIYPLNVKSDLNLH